MVESSNRKSLRAISSADSSVVEIRRSDTSVALRGLGDTGDKSVVLGKSSDNSVADDEDWFASYAQAFYNGKAGPALVFASKSDQRDERNCQRYASGAVKPPSFFLRSLLRDPHGKQWLAAVMDGCTEQWWIDMQRAARVGAAAVAEADK